MAHLIRPWQVRYIDKSGRRVPKGTPGAKRVKGRARKWYGAGVPGCPPKKRFPLASDKGVARQMLADLVRRAERGEAGLQDSVTEARAASLEKHLADYEASQRSKPRPPSDNQLGQVLSRVRKVLDGCAFSHPADLGVEKVKTYLADRRGLPKKEGGISTQTSNFYLSALCQFCRWMVKARRLAENPFLDVERGNVRLDRRHDRRPLKPDELARLLSTALASGRVFRGLAGADRHWLYTPGGPD